MGLSIASAIMMTSLYLLKADINRIYYGTDTRFFSLGLGAALAVIWPVEKLNTNIRKKYTIILDVTGFVSFALLILMCYSK